MQFFGKFLILILIANMTACGKLVDFNIAVVDQKTALENQILGSYEELGNEMVLLASVRSVDEDGKLHSVVEISPAKKQAIKAMQRMEFNKDDILRFKQMGAAGERNDGFLKFFETEKSKADPKFKKFTMTLIVEENEDRRVVLERIIDTNINFTKEDLPKVQKVYASLNRDNANPGEKIQTDDGQWVFK